MGNFLRNVFTAICVVCVGVAVHATTYTGKIGAIQWTLDTESGILTIYGTGDMANYHGNWNYGNSGRAPWYNYRTNVKSIVIEDGVTSIGAAAFYQCTNLTSISMPPSLTKISYEAFRGCSKLEEIDISSGVCTIQDRWVTDCPKLKYIYVDEDNTCFVSIDGIIYTANMETIVKMPDNNPITTYVIPDGVSKMATDAVYSQQNVESITVPVSMTNIDYGVFDNCPKLTTLIFKADTPPTLAKELYGTSLQFIYVPCDAGSSYTGASGNWGSYSNATGGFTESPVITLNTATNNTELGTVATTQQADCEHYMAQVTAKPTVHGIFDHWEEDGEGITEDNIDFHVEVNGVYNYTAIFTPRQYTITTEKGTTKIGRKYVTQYYSVHGGGTYFYGDTIEVSVTIDDISQGLKFSQWSDGNTENPRRVRVTGDKTYSAKISAGQQTVTIKSNDTGMGTVSYSPSSNQNKYDYGTQIIATATPKNGYHFVNWSDDCTSLTDTIIVHGDATYTAYFAINTYKITAAPNDAQMGSCSGYGTFKTGASTTLEATANPGYSFVRWNDGVATRTRTLNNISADADYIAEFAPIPYTITVTTNDAAKGAVSGGGTYDYNTNATIRAVANTGYHFLNWEDDVNAPAERDVLVLGNATYTAKFAVNSYEITATSSNNLFGTVSGGGTYDYNSSVTLTATPKTGYHFVSWNDGVETASRSVTVTGNASYEATFAINQYTVVFKNDDGTELQSSSYEYLAMPSCETPSKASTAQYTYTFADWSPAVVNVTADATYTATYNATVNSYTISFKNEEGTVLQSSKVAYGEKPVYSGATPTKSATMQYSYTFAGWDQTIANVTGDAVYTATFDAVVNQYTVTFKNDGATLQSSLWAYGSTPTYSGVTPAKSSSVQYDYSFNGWTPTIVAVASEAVYSATFASTLREYVVTFRNDDGTVLQASNVAYGTVPVYSGETPEKAADAQYSYTFNGWNKDVVAVTGAITYTATYVSTVNEYTITFVNDDNSVIQSSVFAYGLTPTCNEPTKAATVQYSYTFNGWEPAVASVTGAATYKATYSAKLNKYAVTFKNDDGSVLQVSNVTYGEMPSYGGATPEKSPTAQYTYTFTGWNAEIVAVTGEAIYTATYESTVNEYTILFKNDDGSLLQSSEVPYGTLPVYSGATPGKPATAQYSYSFSGWNKEIVAVVGTATYSATYLTTTKEYLVVFEDEDGTELQSSNVPYGEMPVYSGETPSKEATVQYTYTFNGWDKTIITVTESIVYTATYASTVNQYTIRFKNEDGTVMQTSQVAYGTMPSYSGETPVKSATAQYSYSFAGWDKTLAKVVGNEDYTATYTPSVNKYHITFFDEDGTTVLQEKDVAYGEVPTCQTPTKDATAQYTYTFDGWSPTVATVTEDAEYTASYAATTNSYVVRFVDEDGIKVLQSSNVEYGTVPEYTEAVPEKTSTAQYTYNFSGWDNPLVAVTGNAVYKATYSETVNTYTILFVDENLSKIKEQVYEYGATPSCDAPVKAATAQYTYTFSGWSPEIGTVVGNCTYTATYQAEENTYSVVFKNEDGTELQKFDELVYGMLPVYSGETPTKAATVQYSYTFKGWNKTIVPVTENVVYTATYTSQVNSYRIVFKNYDDSELQSSMVEYGVIPSFSGAIPTKPSDGANTYSFAGWDVEPVAVVGEAVYTATFSNETNKYVITFYDEDGETVLQDDEFVYGATPICGNPQKAATAEYTYTFNGWEPAVAKVTGEASYVATYRAVKNSYSIEFVDEDGTTVLQHSEIEYGETPEFSGVEPTKPSSAQYTYAFNGWDSEITAVTEAATYTATYRATLNEYIVAFNDEDGTELKHTLMKYGEMPSCDEPTKAATAQYTYSFAGWTPEITTVSGAVTYTATYNSEENKYVVLFKNENGDLLQKLENVPYGTVPEFTGETPTKAETSQFSFLFDGWDKTIVSVSADITYTATYVSETKKYTVVFKNFDGTELQSSLIEYGSVPTYEGETPVRPSNDEHTYTFVGWDVAPVHVVSDAVYVAQFSNSLNSYTVSFFDEDGVTLLQTMELLYGATPVFTGEVPTKAANAQYTYHFDTWMPTVKPVNANASYTAKYTAELNSYTIQFLNEDETTVLQSKLWEYGSTPIYTGITPAKASTEQYSYTFEGWNKPIAAVTGNETYVATFSSALNRYLIVFENEDGTELQKSFVEYGSVPLYDGSTPTKASTVQVSYNFTGWDKPIVEVSENATYIATYEETAKKYTVVFKNDDGTVLQSSEYEYGAMPSYDGDNPVKAANAQFTFDFEGWDNTIINVIGDATYTASYHKTTNSYTVVFKNYDGAVLQSSSVLYGEMPSYNGEVPTRPSEAGNNYSFKGWNVPISPVSADAEYVATYSDETTTYPISFYDEDGTTLLQKIDVVYGAMPSCEAPTKAADVQYSYSFDSWYPAIHEVDGPESYVASYRTQKNSYTVTFVDEDGSILLTKTYEYGSMPSCAVPTKAATAQYSYSFNGWNPAVVSVSGDATYTASYRAETNSYRITFIDENGNKLHAQDYEFGAMPSCPAPQKSATAQYTYMFSGWSPAVSEVSETAVYRATYSATVKSYTILFKNDDGSVLQHSQVAYGELPQFNGEEPQKSATAQFSYEFAGWNKTITSVVGDETYLATYSVSTNLYDVTFKNYDGTVLQTEKVAYGAMPSYNQSVPTKPADAENEYTFVGWNKSIDVVTENVEYVAVFSSTTNLYTITFRNYNDTILQSSEFGYGALPTCPIPSRKADERYTYVFESWVPELTAVTSEAEYFATFTSVANKYVVTFVDEDGETVLQKREYEYGAMPSFTGTKPQKSPTEQYSYVFSGWDKSISRVTADAVYTAVYTETERRYTITFVDNDFSVISTSEYPYGTLPSIANPAKSATAQFSYEFEGWKPAISEVSGNATYQAEYAATVNQYEVVFNNADGTELQRTTLSYGAYPFYEGEEPTKSATAQYSYSFSGWNKPIVEVTNDVVYTAVFSESLNEYTIIFKNYNGDILQLSKVAYGAMPSYNGEIPTKPSEGGKKYSFAGWNVVPVKAFENAVYTATFTDATTMFEITFVDDDGSVLQQSNFAYGAMPICAVPAKAADVAYTYTFDSWYPKPTAVTENKTYTATYSSVKNTYTVTFLDDDGVTVLQSANYEYGDKPICQNPAKPSTAQYSYTFAGWNYHVIEVAGDAVYTATYTKALNKYMVSFVDEDNSLISSESYDYGQIPTVANPTKEATAQYEYSFNEWTPAVVEVTADATYKASYSSVEKSYEIVFANSDGTELQRTSEAYGSYPVYIGETPQQSASAQYSYEFAGWNKTIVAVTANATYTAVFTQKTNTYLVTFKDEDGTVLQSSEFEYGAVPSFNQAFPEKSGDDGVTYSFAGWDKALEKVTAEAEYIATYTTETVMYQITFRNYNDQILQRTNFAYGAMPTCFVPTRAADAQFSYEFDSWSPDLIPVERATTYYALYKEHLNSYMVQFVDEDGTVLSGSGVYEYGSKPSYSVPSKPASDQYVYTFTGWNKPVEIVTEDVVYTAVFAKTARKYAITFVDENGEVLSASGDYEYGSLPQCDGPVKQSDSQFSYTFAGWNPTVSNVTGAMTYRPTYSTETQSYTIVFIDDEGTELQQSQVPFGELPEYHGAVPSKEETEQFAFTFAGWNKTIIPVETDMVYTALFEEVTKLYTITFKNEDGTILQQSEFEYGEMPSYDGGLPRKPNDSGNVYAFAGWNIQPVKVVADAVYTATYMLASEMYMITFVDEDGTVLQQTEFTYRSMPTCPIPTKLDDEGYLYRFESWSPELQLVTKDTTYTAVYEKTPKTYVVNFVSEDGSVILSRQEYHYGEMPVFNEEIPAKEGNEQYSYEFCGWSPALEQVKGNATYTISYNTILNQYVVTFKNYDGAILQVSMLNYGDLPEYDGNTPTRASDAASSFVFKGWNYDISPVTGPKTYIAQYTVTAAQYTISATPNNVVYGSVEGSGVYDYFYPLELKAVENYGYRFVRWSDGVIQNPRSLNVVRDFTVEALFEPIKYSLSIAVNNNNYGYIEGGYDLYDYNAEVTVEAVPNEGYEFSQWADGSKNTQKTFVMSGEMYDTAIFKPKTCVASAMTNDILMGTVSGVGSYSYNSIVTLTAEPRDGFVFVKWDDGNINAVRKFVIVGDTTFTALFRPIQYTLTLTVNEIGYGEVFGAGVYDINTDTVIEAKCNYGYEFIEWSDGVVDQTRRVVMVNDTAFEARFKPIVYELSLYSSDETMGSVSGGGSFDYGSEVLISAIPESGYRFDSWSDGNTAAERNYRISATASLVANFVPIEYEVRLSVNDTYFGSVTGAGFYSYHSDVELIASPTYGYRLGTWSNGADGDTITITVQSDTLLIANFVPMQYKLTLKLSEEDAGEISGEGYFEYMQVAEISVSSHEGYEFVEWSDGNTDTVRNIMMTEDMELEAIFRKIETYDFAIYSKPNLILLKNVKDYEIYIINPLGEISHHTAKSPDINVEYFMSTMGVYIVKAISPEGGTTVQKVFVR